MNQLKKKLVNVLSAFVDSSFGLDSRLYSNTAYFLVFFLPSGLLQLKSFFGKSIPKQGVTLLVTLYRQSPLYLDQK